MSVFGYGKPFWRQGTVHLPRSFRRAVRGTAAHLPPLEAVLTADNALAAFAYLKARGGPAAGVDGVRVDDVAAAEVAAAFREFIIPAVLAGTYRPQPARVVEIAKRAGGTRELRLLVVLDRVLARMLYAALVAYLDARLAATSFGFRPGRSAWDLLAAVKVLAERFGLFVVTADDVRKAFDAVVIELLLGLLGDVLPDHRYWAAVAAFVRAEGKEVGIGQGNALSPLLLELMLHAYLDALLAKEVIHPSRTLRYADNVVAITWDVPEGQRLLDHTRSLLHQAHLDLKGDPGRPVDLRGEALPLLGFDLSARDDRVRLSVRDEAWTELTTKLDEAHLAADPRGTAEGVVRGWVACSGPALENRGESYLRMLNRHLTAGGFRGEIPRDALAGWVTEALTGWKKALKKAEDHFGRG